MRIVTSAEIGSLDDLDADRIVLATDPVTAGALSGTELRQREYLGLMQALPPSLCTEVRYVLFRHVTCFAKALKHQPKPVQELSTHELQGPVSRVQLVVCVYICRVYHIHDNSSARPFCRRR